MNTNTKKITETAIAAALIFVVTLTARFPIPVPLASGAYLNLGDVVIYLAAFLLGGPWAAAAAAIGSSLADLAAGAAVYALPTFVIKGCMALVWVRVAGRTNSARRYILAGFAGGLVMAGGYGLFEWAAFGGAYALVSLPFNVIQWVAGAGVSAVLYPAVQRLALTLRR